MLGEFEIGEEDEQDHQWSYAVNVFAGGRLRAMTVTLSYQDYDLWSRGRVAPSRVVEACLAYLLEAGGSGTAADLASSFDCSTLRRTFPTLDEELPQRL